MINILKVVAIVGIILLFAIAYWVAYPKGKAKKGKLEFKERK